MRNSFFVTLLAIISVFCQAEVLTMRFVVDSQQDAGFSNQGFSIKSDPNTLPHIPSDIADKDGYPGSNFLSSDKRHRLSGYELKAALTKFISVQWLYATNLVLAYERVFTIHDAALGVKPISWLPLEVFVLIGLLLKSYWKPDSLLFNPIEQLVVSQDEPFAITSMMLPGNDQQYGQQNQQPSSSSQQASGATSTQLNGYSTSPLSSGSGGGNEGSEQHQHTLGLDCYVDSCHGVCKLRSSTDSKESAEGPLNNGVFPAQFCTERTDIIQAIGYVSVSVSSINPEMVCTLLNQGFDANARGHKGSLLHYAVWAGQSNTVEFLLAHGADPNAPDRTGRCPLWFAVWDGHVQIVELLLHSGASLYHYSYSARALLLCGAIRSGPQMTAILLANGVEPNDPGGMIFPLSVAVGALFPRLEATKLMLANGAKPNARDFMGVKVVHRALQNMLGYFHYPKKAEIITLLLDNHFDPYEQFRVCPNSGNDHNKPDFSLLHEAEKFGHIKAVNILKNYTPKLYQPASLQCWARASIRSRLIQNRINLAPALSTNSHCLQQLPRHLKVFLYRPLSFQDSSN
ncbi:ankyrin repeat domain-containing protein [Endozoicomonas sp. SESOKO2]|uniref:ankyrin repeat domain-containing protein n=1 Tax=Endozoicomonas sp. SESOKO2 TaxID=2828743 RepID=UPI0021489A36|nr:ankyrin repeat domain-containing protein [Endozoicomonas sp. SESOKO2]